MTQDFTPLKKQLNSIMRKLDDCDCQDASGNEQSKVDYNFDILKAPFQGTDFEEDAGMLCGVVKGLHMRAGPEQLKDIVLLLGNAFNDGRAMTPGMDNYTKFLGGLDGMLNQIHKAASTVPSPAFDQNMDTPPMDVKPTPQIGNAHAKLMEFEKYKDSIGMDNEKWERLADEYRRMAAIGNDDFNPTPEMDAEDMNYLREKNRAEQKKYMVQEAMGSVPQ